MTIPDRKRIIDLLLAALCAASFAYLTVQRRSGAAMKVDLAVRGRVHASASPVLTVMARLLATVGSPPVVFLLFAIVILIFRRLDWRRAALSLAAVMAAAVACEVGLKRLIHAARPEPFFGSEPSSYSFPSGHAFFSLSFYGVLASVLGEHLPPGAARIAVWVAAALLVLGVGWSRVYLGVHYPSDVLAGYLAGMLVVSAVVALWPG